MNRYITLLAAAALVCGNALAKSEKKDTICSNENGPLTQHSMVVGAGASNTLDTYLSPLEYKGNAFLLQRETFRMTSLIGGRIAAQSHLRVSATTADNDAQTGTMLSSLLSYSIGWLYKMDVTPDFDIYAGGLFDGNVGVVYNSRGSNNPAQAKAYAGITASGMAIYRFRLRNIPFAARYQTFIPLAGAAFVPEYGQSYYEMFPKENTHGTIHLTSPLNMPTMRHQLMLDFPISTAVIRIGYIGNYEQYKINNLKWHSYNSTFVVGFVKTFRIVPHGKHELVY